jgi:hypothetical protein
VNVQTFKTIQIDSELTVHGNYDGIDIVLTLLGTQAKLKDLKPVDHAGYDPSQACTAGTRVTITSNVATWVQQRSTDTRLCWIHRLVGLGKSSIAATVCRQLDEQRVLAASFFGKRDSPELRDPRRVLTTIIYSRALEWKPYAEMVATAISEDPGIHARHIQPSYEALVRKPLEGITAAKRPVGTLAILIDALDECGDIDTRKQLLIYLQDMSNAAPWLKLIITSRADPDIQEFFGKPSAGWFTAYNVLKYDAIDHIRIFYRSV